MFVDNRRYYIDLSCALLILAAPLKSRPGVTHSRWRGPTVFFCWSVLTWPLRVNSAWLPDWQLWATLVICINPRWRLPTFKFWDPLNISGTAKARNLKFGVRIDYDACYSKKCKIRGQNGRVLCHVTYIYILGPPLYLRNGLR